MERRRGARARVCAPQLRHRYGSQAAGGPTSTTQPPSAISTFAVLRRWVTTACSLYPSGEPQRSRELTSLRGLRSVGPKRPRG